MTWWPELSAAAVIDCKLSVCVTTLDAKRMVAFLATQRPFFDAPDVELLILCPHNLACHLTGVLQSVPRCTVVCDWVKSGPSRKRNMLLERAIGEFIVFLDDDSVFADPSLAARALVFAMEPSVDWLLWAVRYRRTDGLCVDMPPRRFCIGSAGSGIEWNQAFRRETLVEAGGWHPDFCTGERWLSGGALKLMIRLSAMGLHQKLIPSVVIEHPAQLDESDPSSCAKMRRYRYAIGAVLASETGNLGWIGTLAWAVRLGLMAPVRGMAEFARGRWTGGVVRLATPIDCARGVIEWLLSRRKYLDSAVQRH